MLPRIEPEREAELIAGAARGDDSAINGLLEPWRKPLLSYIYRMVTNRADAEDLLQDTLMRVLGNLMKFRGESSFSTWLFGIATHVCLDHLRRRRRWRVEAQLIGERETDSDPDAFEGLRALMSDSDFTYEIREHVAFCFSCISRTLEPEEQAAIMLREVLGFTALEASRIMEVSEPVFRHRLSAARAKMISTYDGLCQLINKTGMCHQCRSLQEFAPEGRKGVDLVRITVSPGVAVSSDSLFDARLAIVRETDLEGGSSRAMHDSFFEGLSAREETR